MRLRRHQPTRDYMPRRLTEGKTKNEIIRCLKRYVAREIFHALQPPRPTAEIVAIRSICYQGPNLSNGVFQAPLLAWASHQLLPTDPSSPTQNTSR